MPARLNIFAPNIHLRPKLACEITPEGIAAARRSEARRSEARRSEDGEAVFSFAPLPSGSLAPGLKTPNLVNAAAVEASVRAALEQVAARDRNVTVIVSDSAVRVLMLEFDSLPSRQRDAEPIVRFRLRKLLPFEVEDASISYQVMSSTGSEVRALVTAMPAAVLAEYESVVRAAGFEPGAVLPGTLAALAGLRTAEAALLVNRNGLSLTTAIARADELLLHRTIELPQQPFLQTEEIAQAVSVAEAYFEDTLQSTPASIYYIGPGGAERFSQMLGAEAQGPRVRDLVAAQQTGATSAIPKGLIAGVTGALAI